jgi:hypothetical protein
MKGIIFAGCSFTWGEGLELYSNYPSVNVNSIKRYSYNFPDLGYFMPKSHLKFIESNRFSRLVSHHFGTFDLVAEKNGGNHSTMLTHIKKSLLDYGSDVGLIVVQLTEYLRGLKVHDNCNDECCSKDLVRMVEDYYAYKSGDKDEDKKYYHDIIEKNIEEEPEYFLKSVGKSELNNFINNLQEINKETNIPIKFLGSWLESNLPIENDFYDNNLITINYKDKEYKTLADLLSDHNNELIIANELEWSNNWHPNLKFQKVISENIINYIEKNSVL